MKILKFIAIILFAVTALSGCRKEQVTTQDPRDSFVENWQQAFDTFWNGMNVNYTFWDVDPTDWDKVREVYRPKFAGLNFFVEADDRKAKELFTELTSTLVDHHMVITFNETTIKGEYINPAIVELKKRTYYRESYNRRAITMATRRYLEEGRITNLSDGIGNQMALMAYIIDEDVAYIHLTSFGLTNEIEEEPDGQVAKSFLNFLSIVKNTTNLKGIIIDVRCNGGGDVSDLSTIFGELIDKPVQYGFSRTKNGMNRLDYSPWTPWEVFPKETSLKVSNLPVVALTELYSASMSEITAMMIKTLPKGKVIGERTYGAQGPLNAPYYITYTGSFAVGVNNLMSVKTSSHRAKDINGNSYEGYGITPDIEVLWDAKALEEGIDNPLERAIQHIKTGN